ncbi:hypothetical protein DFJ73DRAFT_846619 [Zopfochytrium polystomum]|nr:hypothetical protein DFJ73DRAFT_846619 [Zopfochytrium polystomum]
MPRRAANSSSSISGKNGSAKAAAPVEKLLQAQVPAADRRRLADALRCAELIRDTRTLAPATTTTADDDHDDDDDNGPMTIRVVRADAFAAAAQLIERSAAAAAAASTAASTPSRAPRHRPTRSAAATSHRASSPSSPLVLDFASDTTPGGGWRGGQQGTQEESLCGRSTLGLALEHAAAAAGSYPIPAFGAVYVPDVAVVQLQPSAGTTATTATTGGVFWCSAVAAALRANGADAAYVAAKVDGVLRVARARGHDEVVLGAWGCGAFGGDAEAVARAFRAVLVGGGGGGRGCRGWLRRAVFAVKGKEQYEVFCKVFAAEIAGAGGGEDDE